MLDNLYKNGRSSFRLNIDKERDWTVELQFNDMRSPDYVAAYETEKGTFKYENYTLNTFKGNTSDGKMARFTIDKDNFFGVIFAKKTHFVIRPTKDFTRNEKDESLIVYERSDLIQDESSGDYINDVLETSGIKQMQLQNAANAPIFNDCPFYLAIATDADFDFYQDNGSNLNSTYNAIFTVLNIVEGVYESTFNMKFVITFQNVYTSSSTPYSTTNASNLLNAFRNHWENNRTTVPRHLAHLFTGKDLDGNIVGIAKQGHISNSESYALSMFRVAMYQTTAHEIGHNFNAGHPTQSNCFCDSPNASVMCQGQKRSDLWFCDESISQISNFIFVHRIVPICYTGVDQFGLGTTLNLSGSISGVREYFSGQTINSSQVINSGIIKYNAGTEIVLSHGFHAQPGSNFEAKIDDVSACNPVTETTLNACLWIMMQASSAQDSIMLTLLENATALTNVENFDFTVYPNPSDGNFTVKIAGNVQPYTLEIFNASGGMLGKMNCSAERVNINRTDLSSGIYYLKLEISGHIVVKKLIVKKF